MFRLADQGLIWVPVVVPGDDGEDTTIHLLMQVMDEDELAGREKDVALRSAEGFLAKAQETRTREDLERLMEEVSRVRASDKQELIARTSNWHGVHDSNGDAVPFSAERMAALLRWHWLAKRVRSAFFQASREGVSKNSLPGLAGLPARGQA